MRNHLGGKTVFAGKSGCYGIVVYDTNIDGNNAVYGYYKGDAMHFETGTAEQMNELRKKQEDGIEEKGVSAKTVVGSFLLFVAVAISGFVLLPLKVAFALLVFLVLGYMPVMVIAAASSGLYSDPQQRLSFRRMHGCEHAVVSALTKEKTCEMTVLEKTSCYDTECGTAYSGYALALALEIALLIIFWPGILKAAGILLLSVLILIVMILCPKINPFTLIQHPVVLPPTERELQLGLGIMKKVKEL